MGEIEVEIVMNRRDKWICEFITTSTFKILHMVEREKNCTKNESKGDIERRERIHQAMHASVEWITEIIRSNL